MNQKPTSDQLIAQFTQGVQGQADIDVAEVVHAMFKDILEAVRLALKDTDIPQGQLDLALWEVEDYISNHYGDM